jgi:hypothetical protein
VRLRKVGSVVLLALLLGGVVVVSGGKLATAKRRKTSSSPTTTAAVAGRDGQVLDPVSIQDFEISCRALGLPSGNEFCRCARTRLGGHVVQAEVRQATESFLGGAQPVPSAIRAVMDSCTAKPTATSPRPAPTSVPPRSVPPASGTTSAPPSSG